MPRRCGCQSGSCSCFISGTPPVTVAGSGSQADPYLIGTSFSLAGLLSVVDTATIDMTLSGAGTTVSPYVIQAAVKNPGATTLDQLTDVSTGGATNGQQLTYNAGLWSPGAALAAQVAELKARIEALEAG